MISSENIEQKFDELVWLESITGEEFLAEFIKNNIYKIVNPEKDTLLHSFIRKYFYFYVCNEFYEFEDSIYNTSEYDQLYSLLDKFEIFIKDSGFELTEWENRISLLVEVADIEFEKNDPEIMHLEKEIKELLDDLRDEILEKNDKLTDNVFFLLFSNKKFLFDFNFMISKYITPENLTDEIFNQFRHIQRSTYLPTWLKNGIIYRDRATCQSCGEDLSNSFRIMEIGYLHFDHIIPLEKRGTNDSTNFQLLCSKCNLTKNDNLELIDYKYQMYWR